MDKWWLAIQIGTVNTVLVLFHYSACVPITLKAKSSQELVSYSCQVGVLTHLEPDILECKVKQTLGSTSTNKASGSDGIPVELFQILKYDAVKVLHSIWQQVWKTHQGPQDWKRSVFIPSPRKGNAKEYSDYCLIALTSHASKVMLKINQARLQQFLVNWEFQMFKLDLKKAG